VLIAAGLIFAFNNLAPPYEGRWQMRGDFIPRLYQPIFVALLVYCARVAGDVGTLSGARPRLVLAAAAFALVGNLSIAFGPIAHVPWTGVIYHRFYEHSGPDTMDRLLAAHGRRPLGFCRPDDAAVGSSRVPGAPADAPLSLEREYGWARSIDRCTPAVTGALPARP
jgi:hypothetical protein